MGNRRRRPVEKNETWGIEEESAVEKNETWGTEEGGAVEIRLEKSSRIDPIEKKIKIFLV